MDDTHFAQEHLYSEQAEEFDLGSRFIVIARFIKLLRRDIQARWFLVNRDRYLDVFTS
jgi:hypothetical protein